LANKKHKKGEPRTIMVDPGLDGLRRGLRFLGGVLPAEFPEGAAVPSRLAERIQHAVDGSLNAKSIPPQTLDRLFVHGMRGLGNIPPETIFLPGPGEAGRPTK
jgi:hypothetical protein